MLVSTPMDSKFLWSGGGVVKIGRNVKHQGNSEIQSCHLCDMVEFVYSVNAKKLKGKKQVKTLSIIVCVHV